MRDSLVAINLTNSSNVLLNKTLVPILFYWNGEGDLEEAIKHDEEFIKYIEGLLIENDNYLDIFVSYFYFKYDEDGKERYEDVGLELQDVVKLTDFRSSRLVNYYLVKHCKELYSISFKEEYNEELNNEELITDIYKKLTDKFKTRLSKETFVNWFRSELNDKDHLNTKNIDFIIETLNNILKDFD